MLPSPDFSGQASAKISWWVNDSTRIQQQLIMKSMQEWAPQEFAVYASLAQAASAVAPVHAPFSVVLSAFESRQL